MSQSFVNSKIVDPTTEFIEKAFVKIAKQNNLPNEFNWSSINQPFEQFTMYTDRRPVVSTSSSTIKK